MGGGPSRISVEEAKQRLNHTEQEELQKWFSALSSNNRLSLAAFRDGDVIHSLPQTLTKRLFIAMTRFDDENAPQRQSVSREAVIRVRAVADRRKSTEEERFQLCFDCCDMTGNGKISKAELQTCLEEIAVGAERAFHVDILGQNPPPSFSNEERLEGRRQLVSNLAHSAFRNVQNSDLLEIENFSRFMRNYGQISDFICYVYERAISPSASLPGSLEMLKEALPPLFMGGKSHILTKHMAIQLRDWLPPDQQDYYFYKLFISKEQGNSLGILCHRSVTRIMELEKSSYLVIKTTKGEVFGAYADSVWKKTSSEFYGGNDCFLFKLSPRMERYRAAASASNFMYSNSSDCLGLGGRIPSFFGLMLDDTVSRGKTTECNTYNSPALCESEEFTAEAVELWGLLNPEKEVMKCEFDAPTTNSDDEEVKDHEKGVLGHKQQRYVLELLNGRGYSQNLEPVEE